MFLAFARLLISFGRHPHIFQACTSWRPSINKGDGTSPAKRCLRSANENTSIMPGPIRCWILTCSRMSTLRPCSSIIQFPEAAILIETRLWRFLVKKVPNCVAPSTLSVCGLACNVVAVCVTVYHAPTLTEDLPGRICFVNAISIL